MRLYSLVDVLGDFEVLRCVVWFKFSKSSGMGRSRAVSFTCRPFYTWGQRPRCPLNMRLDGPCTLPGRFGVQEGLLCLSEIDKLPAGRVIYITNFLRDMRSYSLVTN